MDECVVFGGGGSDGFELIDEFELVWNERTELARSKINIFTGSHWDWPVLRIDVDANLKFSGQGSPADIRGTFEYGNSVTESIGDLSSGFKRLLGSRFGFKQTFEDDNPDYTHPGFTGTSYCRLYFNYTSSSSITFAEAGSYLKARLYGKKYIF